MPSWVDLLAGAAPAEVLDEARTLQKEGQDAASVLLERGVPENQILAALSRHHRRPAIRVTDYDPEEEAVSLLTHEVARRFGLLPLFRLEDRLYAAVVDPDDLPAQDYVRRLTGFSVEPVLVLRPDLEEGLQRHYLSKDRVRREMRQIGAAREAAQAPQEVETVQVLEDRESPAIRAVQEILTRAVLLNASDVHLEPMSRKAQLRYRIDGLLHDFPAPPLQMYPAVVSRLKITSGMDISEKRLPQDGRGMITVEGRPYDLRVSVIPNIHGEGCVIRILNSAQAEKDLRELGFEQATLARWDTLIRRPHGIVLVTGPTGSGKTTTLYSSLRRIDSPHRKLITLEDPVEFQLDGITQIAIRNEIGLTFASALRSILRHDPDVVMVGEIRDLESAEIAVRAALTGHLLFATLHTNDAAQAITRLVDMGLQSFQVMASLAGVLAQRLVRRLCVQCKVETTPTAAEAEALHRSGVTPEPGTRVYGPKGCAACGNLGYRGRLAIYELLEVDARMRRLKPEEVTAANLQLLAREAGMVSLRESAVMRLYSGETSLEEVLAITVEE